MGVEFQPLVPSPESPVCLDVVVQAELVGMRA